MPISLTQRSTSPLTAALAASALLFASLGNTALAQQAQPPAGMSGAPQQAGKTQQLRGEIQNLRKQVGEVQQEVLEDNTQLQEQSQAVASLMQEKMVEVDPDAEQKVARLQSIMQQVKSGEVAEEKQKELLTEFQQLRQAMQQAQQQVFNDPDVVKQQGKLQDAMTVAMVDHDPSVEAKLKQLKDLTEQYRSMSPGG